MEEEKKIQYILDENGELCEMLKEDAIPVEHPIKYKLKNAFEVFVQVEGTENYWISNYGRGLNNIKYKDKNSFYEHKTGKCHYTVYEIEKVIVSYPIKRQKNGIQRINKKKECIEYVCPKGMTDEECEVVVIELQSNSGNRKYELKNYRRKRDTSPEKLVAETFLVKYDDRNKIWHKDGNESNNWYKNLLYVSAKDYMDLKSGKITWQELDLEQEYIEYRNKSSYEAYKVYNHVKMRCSDTKENDNIGKCYDEVAMCTEWKENPKAFVKWYLTHYYEVDDEIMEVDKDLFGKDAKEYSPDNCCILPKRLNVLLANCKKHYLEGQTKENVLPLGIRYNNESGKYFGQISLSSEKLDKGMILSEWDTPEKAFEEYKIIKKADFILAVTKYKEKIPEYIYKELLKVEVKPY